MPKQRYDHLDMASVAHSGSEKWSKFEDDVIPMWIADMDFPVAEPILQAIRHRLELSIGYPDLESDKPLIAALKPYLAKQGLNDLPDQGFHFLAGLVPALYAAINSLATPGDAILTMTPIYHPFHLAIQEMGNRILSVPLVSGETRYEIDWDAMQKADRQTQLMMLCHPHNPTGRMWDKEELTQLRDLAIEHDLIVLSDEIHADLNFTDQPFESFAADPRVREQTLVITGPCKTYNTAGLGIGAFITYNTALLQKVLIPIRGLLGPPALLSSTMWQAALAEGGPWLKDTVSYLKGNRNDLSNYLREHLPWIQFHPVEATYLAWLDLREHDRAGDIQQFLLKNAKVGLHDGPTFAPNHLKEEYQGFVRLNFATSQVILHDALDRIKLALT